MAKNDSDLFDRLRQAGLRTPVAKTLSKISEGASKKSLQAARSAVGELRSLAGEIERRLPSATAQSATSKPTSATASRAKRPVTERKSAVAPTHKTAAAAGTSGARSPRGQNKAKILESLKADSKTAVEIAQETGIGTGTVRSTLSKLAIAGEVAKGDRGYQIPQELEFEPQQRTDDAREHPAGEQADEQSVSMSMSRRRRTRSKRSDPPRTPTMPRMARMPASTPSTLLSGLTEQSASMSRPRRTRSKRPSTPRPRVSHSHRDNSPSVPTLRRSQPLTRSRCRPGFVTRERVPEASRR